MNKRQESIEQAKEYLFAELELALQQDCIRLDTILLLQKVVKLPVDPIEGQSMPVDFEDTEDVGIGWIEENMTDPDDPDYIGDVRPCVWFRSIAFDSENEDFDLTVRSEDWGYNHWRDGFRLWSDGAKPTMKQRNAWEWRK